MADSAFTYDEPRLLVLANGQSNMSRELQAEILRRATNEGPRLVKAQTTFHGGQSLDTWISGSAGSFQRDDHWHYDYCHTDPTVDLSVAPHSGYDGSISAGVQADVESFGANPFDIAYFHFQGESDAASSSLYDSYQDRLTEYLNCLRADTGARNVRSVFAKIYRTDTVNETGIGIINAALQAIADADPLAEIVETSDFPRSDNVHIDDDGSRELCGGRMWGALIKP